MNLGFTGTQSGMTANQLIELVDFITNNTITHAYHGDCIGADSEFHTLLREYSPSTIITIFPPSNNSKRAYNKADILMPEDTYMKRNQSIVNACDILIAGIPTTHELRRSGTWSTVRKARKADKDILLLQR